MPSSNDIRAGRAFVEIGAETNPLKAGLDQAKQRLAAFGSALQTLGSALALGFAVKKVQGWVESFAEGGRELFLLARQSQVSVEELQELKKTSQDLGIEFDVMQTAVGKARQFVAELATSGQQTNDTMRALGLTLNDVASLSDLDRLNLFGERIRALGNRDMTARIGRAIFGRGGLGVAGAIGSGEFASARAHAQESPGFSAEQVQQAFDLSQAMRSFGRAVTSVGREIGGVLAPGFKAIYQFVTPIVKGVRDWVRANSELVGKIALAAGLVAGIGTALLTVASGVSLIGFVAGGLVTAFTSIWWVITSIAGIVAFAFSPFSIVVGLAAVFLIDLGKISGMFAEIGRGAARLGAIFDESFGGIRDAFGADDLGLAWEIALAGMKVAWEEAIAYLKDAWSAFDDWFASTFGAKVSEVAAKVKELVDEIKKLDNTNNNGQLPGPMGDAQRAGERHRAWLAQLFGQEQQAVMVTGNTRGAQQGQAAAPAATPSQRDLTAAEIAQIQLENLREAASIAAGAAAARRAAQLAEPTRGLNEFAIRDNTARSTFNRDTLWGLGGSPVTRLVDNTQRMIELLMPLRRIDANIQRMGPAEVS